MNIGLLSTAKDFGLVQETLTVMGVQSASTEVVAIITAGNEKGRASNAFADRTFSALSAAGFTQIREVDIAGMDEEEVRGELTPKDADGTKNQLLVVTGGDKHYLHQQLRATKGDRVITNQVQSGEVPILTVSAGTVLMGETLEVAGNDILSRLRGIGIVPATIVCHFNREKEERVKNDLATGKWGADTIYGLGDEQALVGGDTQLQVIGKGDLTVLTRLPLQHEHHQTQTKLVTLKEN